MRSESRDSAGFSLIELMVSVAVFGLITAQLLVVFSNQKRVYSSNERALDVQEQARLTLDLVAFDTRMGGFMVPRWTAVSSVDGGTDAADRFCVSDASYFDFTGAPSPLDTKAFPFDGAQVTALAADHVTVSRPNIVWIMGDDLGYGDLGCYGQRRIRTPHIDRLAEEGTRFTDAYSGCTVCAPARSVLLTGRHMGHTSVRSNPGGVPLLVEDVTVAEVLKQAGYATGCFGKWGLGEPGTEGTPVAVFRRMAAVRGLAQPFDQPGA